MKNWEYVVTIKISGVGIEAETKEEAFEAIANLMEELNSIKDLKPEEVEIKESI